LVLVGQPGCGKLEYLQLAAAFNDALVLEPIAPRTSSPLTFISSFKSALISALTTNQRTFILISDISLRDPQYLDFVTLFLSHSCNKFETVLFWADADFRRALIENERGLYNAATVKRP
jgi:hypothetical protein